MFKKILKIFLVFDLAVLNGVVLFLVLKPLPPNPQPQVNTQQQTIYQDTCGQECKNYIDASLKSLLPTPKATAVPTPTPKVIVARTPTKSKTRSVQYVTIPGLGGNTAQMDWVTVSDTDFYFDKADYPGLVEAYFEANMRLSGGGTAFVRLYDATHGIGVQGSDIQTESNTNLLQVSGKLNFWAGKNLYMVQIKSLTTEQTYYNSGRIKLVSENG